MPYDIVHIAAAIRQRSRHGTNFSIVAVAEGAMCMEDAAAFEKAEEQRKNATSKTQRQRAKTEIAVLTARHSGNTLRLAKQLEELTHLEARVTILGYVQRGGTPSAGDRLLATRLGTMCLELIQDKVFGVMVAARGDGARPVPISDVAGKLKTVPADHPWIDSARRVGTCMGD
jgi:6-phosphofructokinase 1